MNDADTTASLDYGAPRDTATTGRTAKQATGVVAYLVRETDYWCKAQHEAAQHLREISERMQAVTR